MTDLPTPAARAERREDATAISVYGQLQGKKNKKGRRLIYPSVSYRDVPKIIYARAIDPNRSEESQDRNAVALLRAMSQRELAESGALIAVPTVGLTIVVDAPSRQQPIHVAGVAIDHATQPILDLPDQPPCPNEP